jgi:hypothetical protein
MRTSLMHFIQNFTEMEQIMSVIFHLNRVFENRVLRRIFEQKIDEVT